MFFKVSLHNTVGVIVNIIKPILSRSVFLICYEENQTIPN